MMLLTVTASVVASCLASPTDVEISHDVFVDSSPRVYGKHLDASESVLAFQLDYQRAVVLSADFPETGDASILDLATLPGRSPDSRLMLGDVAVCSTGVCAISYLTLRGDLPSGVALFEIGADGHWHLADTWTADQTPDMPTEWIGSSRCEIAGTSVFLSPLVIGCFMLYMLFLLDFVIMLGNL